MGLSLVHTTPGSKFLILIGRHINTMTFHTLAVTWHSISSLSRYVLYKDRRVTGWSRRRYFRRKFRFPDFWGVMVFWTASFWLTSKLYIQYKLYVGNFVKNTLWGGMCLSTDSNTRDRDVTKVTFWCHKMWLMSMGFKRATENLMTSESVTKWSKMVRLVGMCCEACGQMDRKYNRKWTGSYTDHGKQNKQKECLRSTNNYVIITSLMYYIEDLVIWIVDESRDNLGFEVSRKFRFMIHIYES